MTQPERTSTGGGGTVYFEDIEVGRTYWGSELVADEEELIAYGRRFDPWPMHTDPYIGDASPLGGLVASGGYTISLHYLSVHAILNAPGAEWAFLGGFDWHVQFPKPLLPGEHVRVRLVVVEKRRSSKPGRGIVTAEVDLVDRRDDPVLRIRVAFMMATTPTSSQPRDEPTS